MSCIVYQTDRKTGKKYAYESVSYWDKEKQQPRSKRKYLGKVDPETGEIIKKKERTHHSGDNAIEDNALATLKKQLEEKEARINDLSRELSTLTEKYKKLTKFISKIQTLATDALSE